jgi:hypothetical protein
MLFHLHLQVWYSRGMSLPSRVVRGIEKQAKFVHYAVPEKPNEFSLSPPLCFSEPYCLYKTTVPLSVCPFFFPRTFLSVWFLYFLFFTILNVLRNSICPFLGVFSVLHLLLLLFSSRCDNFQHFLSPLSHLTLPLSLSSTPSPFPFQLRTTCVTF